MVDPTKFYSDKRLNEKYDYYSSAQGSFKVSEGYIASKALTDAVNVALFLDKPLLISGEPGVGKTQLAYNLAYRLNLGEVHRFNVKSTTQFKDILYQYDALRHFHYAQNGENINLNEEEVESNFIRFKALGAAIKANEKKVVLIDEIDKAQFDFPNDILDILEELAFEVPEVSKSYTCEKENKPIIIMTSNALRDFPDAFLRRCIYYHIDFPQEAELARILISRISDLDESIVTDSVIPKYLEIRSMISHKKPSIFELLNWAYYLHKHDFDFKHLGEIDQLSVDDKSLVSSSYSILAKSADDLELLNNLFETNSV